MNTPNKLTILRIFIVIPFIMLMGFVIYYNYNSEKILIQDSKGIYMLYGAGGVFLFAMITDFLDGYLAKKNNQITTFGKLFDPLADKFITTTALITLSIIGLIPFWLTLIFVLRDILVDGSRNLAASNNVKVAASVYGKIKTVLQTIGILLIFFSASLTKEGTDTINPSWKIWIINIPLFIAGIASVLSGYLYFKKITPFITTK